MEVLLFGMIAEQAGADKLSLQASSLNGLRTILMERLPGLGKLSYAIAVDRIVVHGDMSLTGSEEIAVLPPFAGG